MSFQTGDVVLRVHDEHKYQIEDKTAALWDLALWGHPAWMDSNSNVFAIPAATYLVMYHRMNMALNKLTIAQIIGGVRGVIPDSKLAKYGDYRYETNFEDMYCNTEDIKEKQLFVEKREHIYNQQRLCYSKSLNSETVQDVSAYQHEKEFELKVKKSLNGWLDKIKNVLEGARRISSVAQALDSWTEELIKTCLRFIYVARINESVLKIMNSEISFITDYEQLPKEPISRTELLSLPQPELGEEFIMDLKEIDALWLKLASPDVRKIWSNQNKMFQELTKDSSEDQQFPLITVNFLRRFRQRKSSECSFERIDVPKDVAVGLLGSLLETIDETSMESSPGQSVAETECKRYFLQAHGDLTKQLFPRRMHLNPPERDISTAIKRTCVQNATGKAPIHELPSKMDPMVPPEGLIMPLRFYMCVPPPPLASAMRIQAVVRQQQYVLRQPRNTMVKVSSSHSTPQQVQGKVPIAPMTCIPPQGFIQTPAPINNWNYTCSQKANNPMQIKPQYSRINTGIFYQQNHSKDISDISKLHSKRYVGLENLIARRNEVKYTKWDKGMNENSDFKCPNGSGLKVDKPLLQANCETNVRFRLYQNIAKSCNAIQPAVYENVNQQIVSSIYDIKPKSQLQIREAGMTMNINNNGLKFIRLPPLGAPYKLSPRSQTIIPFTHKPRFMGAITVNDLKLAHERLFYQKRNTEDNHKGILIDNFVLNKQENCTTCEEKVEKWLETVNYYMKSRSCVNIEELELQGPSLLEIPSNCIMSSHAESEEWRNNEYKTEKKTGISNVFSDKKCKGHARAFAKYKRKDVRQLIIKPLVLFQSSLKLKKGNDLEGMVKILNRYFAEFNLKGMRCNSKNKIRNIKFDRSLPENKRKQTARKNKCLFMLGTKREGLALPGQNYFEIACGFSKSNINEFKTLCRETNEFNAFPSKRMKICSSMSLFLDKEPCLYNELKGKISSINYFDMLTDDLFFSIKNPNVEISETPSMNTKMITGWAHFKIVIKTILQNILANLNKMNVEK